jgi:hypothetical protein
MARPAARLRRVKCGAAEGTGPGAEAEGPAAGGAEEAEVRCGEDTGSAGGAEAGAPVGGGEPLSGAMALIWFYGVLTGAKRRDS